MASEISLNPALGATVHICGSVDEAIALGPTRIFNAAQMLVIDDLPWSADLGVLREQLIPIPPDPNKPFDNGPEIVPFARERNLLQAELGQLFDRLYPDLLPAELRRKSFRPGLTVNEPMHYDFRPETAGAPVLTAFMNVSATPRRYRIGRSFAQLWEQDRSAMMPLVRKAQRKGKNISAVLKAETGMERGPLGPSSPKHEVDMAPGAVWFFNAKTLAHEVVYGEGAVHMDWIVRKSRALQQMDLIVQWTNVR